jgi:hypothetical protein
VVYQKSRELRCREFFPAFTVIEMLLTYYSKHLHEILTLMHV